MRMPRDCGGGLVEVDATWGTVQPLELAPGVRTIGELELIAHVQSGLPAIDTRLAQYHREATIPGASAIPHTEILERRAELDEATPTVFFCNGPQCSATPDAIAELLAAGHPASAILYYRGGLHDWTTLGYPTVPGD